ncbi:hypothetical protein ACVW2K_004496 [Nocardioides sp. HB32]
MPEDVVLELRRLELLILLSLARKVHRDGLVLSDD